MLNSQAHHTSGGWGSGGHIRQVVFILGSILCANPLYSMMPTDLQGKSGNPCRDRAFCTRHCFMRNTHRVALTSVTS